MNWLRKLTNTLFPPPVDKTIVIKQDKKESFPVYQVTDVTNPSAEPEQSKRATNKNTEQLEARHLYPADQLVIEANSKTSDGLPVISFKPFQATYKPEPELNEDRIFSGLLEEQHPVIILADGASTSIINNIEVSGQGGHVAELAVQIAHDYLSQYFRYIHQNRKSKSLDLNEVLEVLRSIYPHVSRHIFKTNQAGSTTLLIALLIVIPDKEHKDNKHYWVYSHLGDGRITLFNPRRKIDNWLIPSFLISPGHSLPGGATATVPTNRFKPIVGAIAHEPEDILLVASDGVEGVEKKIFAKTQIDLANTIWRINFQKSPHSIPKTWSIPDYDPNKLSDDLSIGLIWTGAQNVYRRTKNHN